MRMLDGSVLITMLQRLAVAAGNLSMHPPRGAVTLQL
jgi:hypothetical protein